MALYRLKNRAQFQAVLAGKVVARTEHFVLHCCSLSQRGAQSESPLFTENGVWLGAMIPKRWAKKAVTRNAIKRQVYSLGAACALTLPERAHVVRLRSTFDRAEFQSASSDVLKRAVRAELVQLLGFGPIAERTQVP